MVDRKYEKAQLQNIVDAVTTLNDDTKSGLLKLLQKYETLFDGPLGTWKGVKCNLELKPGAKPYYGRPYPVPKVYEEEFKKTVE